jgi:uncharacterized membrane protein YkvA (DUF1232 family)
VDEEQNPPVQLMDKSKAWARRVKRDGVTLWFAKNHPHTPWAAKALGVVVVAYSLSPIDLIPDFIPIIGYLDDLVLLPVLIWLTVRMLPSDVLTECRHKAEQWMEASHAKPLSIGGAVVIILIWILVVTATAYWFYPALTSSKSN